MKLITLDEYCMGRDAIAPEEWEIAKSNAIILLEKVNGFLQELNYPFDMYISSGFRPSYINSRTPGASKGSYHIDGRAIDLKSKDNEFYHAFDPLFNTLHSDLLRKYGLFMEHPDSTKKFTIERINGVEHTQMHYWNHLDIGNRVDRPTRVFKP